jgi:alpha-galactosidase
MPEREKIVLIGAGSAMFTQGLVADLILSGRPWRLGLVDIDPQALATAEGLSRRMVEARGADITLEASTDRRDVLPSSDVVVTTIGVGGRRAWEADVFIPRRYGIYQPVGDTVMPGGISRALRMVPALIDIARDVLRLAPGARFFNYSNPMTVNCWAVRQATGADVVGLCHGVPEVERELARFIGAPPAEVTSTAVGVNHFAWLYDLRWRGRDAWPLVRGRLAEERGEGVDLAALGLPAGSSLGVRPRAADNPLSWSLYAEHGAYPAVNDRHVSEFFPRLFPGGRYYGKTLGVDAFSFEGTIAMGDEIYARMGEQAAGRAPLDERLFQRGPGEHEQLLAILQSMAGDERRVFSANLPNRGAVPNLPAGAVLELPAVASARGFRAVQVLDFPAALADTVRTRLVLQEVTVAAALTGSSKLFVEALLADGAVTDKAMAEKLAGDLIRVHAAYLPQFA